MHTLFSTSCSSTEQRNVYCSLVNFLGCMNFDKQPVQRKHGSQGPLWHFLARAMSLYGQKYTCCSFSIKSCQSRSKGHLKLSLCGQKFMQIRAVVLWQKAIEVVVNLKSKVT